MENGQDFVDFYALLQVNPGCDAKMLEKAYRHFAHMYHPDHSETADVGKFQEVIQAYDVLRDPERRAEYDRVHRVKGKRGFYQIPEDDDIRIEEKSALEDAEAHEKILYYLYKRRREHADDPGVIGYYVQRLLECSYESFEFHVWYLKNKGFIDKTEQGTLAITIDGVDHVISMSRATEEKKLITAQNASERS